MSTPDITSAKKLLNEDVRDFFMAEIANERDGGVTPSTLSSAIDSVAQAPDYVLERVLKNGVADSMRVLLVLRDMLPGDTLLIDLL